MNTENNSSPKLPGPRQGLWNSLNTTLKKNSFDGDIKSYVTGRSRAPVRTLRGVECRGGSKLYSETIEDFVKVTRK